MDLLDDTVSVHDVVGEDFDAIYLTGGHGTMFDFPNNPDWPASSSGSTRRARLSQRSATGPPGSSGVRREDGTPLLQGREVTGFSWPEEAHAGRAKVVPFRLDDRLREGAPTTRAPTPLASNVVVDEPARHGAEPTSASGVAKKVVKLLKKG